MHDVTDATDSLRIRSSVQFFGADNSVWWLEVMLDALPGPDYFDQETKFYSGLFEFCQVTFCNSRQSHDFGKILHNNLVSILPPWQNNPIATVMKAKYVKIVCFI